MGPHLSRAIVLYEQGRYDLAEEELRLELAADPRSPRPHALLALCCSNREAFAEATTEAEAAIGLDPDSGFVHYVHALVMNDRNRDEEALRSIQEAIRLDPEDADHHGVHAAVLLKKRRWTDALQATERGLALDPEHLHCNNLRAMALAKLGRRAEAGATIAEALRRDPEDELSHANQGWTLLQEGRPREAMEHFREALRLRPGLEWARAGLIEAMKARNIVYRLLLRYFLWMARLSSRAQWGVMIGGYLGFRVLRGLARDNPRLSPWVMPLVIAYLAFCLLSWTGDALFNLLLRLDRFGRYALSKEQVIASDCVGACLFLGAVFLGTYVATGQSPHLAGAAVFGFLSIPTSATFHCDRGWPRKVMAACTVVLAFAGLWSMWQARQGEMPSAFGIFLLGAFASQFLGAFLMQAKVRK